MKTVTSLSLIGAVALLPVAFLGTIVLLLIAPSVAKQHVTVESTHIQIGSSYLLKQGEPITIQGSSIDLNNQNLHL